MKARLFIEGSNKGGEFLKKYENEVVDIQSLFKDIEANAPPLSIIKMIDGVSISFQIIDVRFIDEFIFINGYAINDETSNGGKVLIRLKPVQASMM